MMERYTFKKDLSLKKQYDVIVAGGGVAGVAAAVSAAKRGASVLLLEKSNILGGLATLGLVNLFVPMCNGRGKQIIFGLCERWVRMSATLGYSTIPKEWQAGEPEEPTEVRYAQRYSPYIFAMQLLEELRASGANILFDCVATEPVMDGKVCRGVITNSKSGLELYGCKMLIDTTGDCDILRAAGVPVVKGQNFFTYYARMLTLDGCRNALERGKISDAVKSVWGGNINLWGDGQPEGVPKWSGTTVEEVTDYLVTNQVLMLENLKKCGGEGVDVTHFPLMPQFRTTCRIDGDYTFSVGDAYRHFEDSVGAINDFEHRDHLFEVPYRALVRGDYPNIITAGRSASGKGYGWDLLRVIPPAIITGQAAGEAAALALKSNTGVAFVDIKKLQGSLEEANVMIHFPDEYVPEDRTIILHGKNVAEIEGGHI